MTLKHVLCTSAHRIGLVSLAASLVEPRDDKPGDRPYQVLVYHRIADEGDVFVPALSVAGFEQHMRCLREHFRPMSLGALLTAAEQHAVPPRAIAVTFDDGYLDTYTHALPVLQRYDIPATVYVATGFTEDGSSMWNDRIGCAVRDSCRSELEAIDDLPPLPLATQAERETAALRLIAALKPRRPEERDALTARVLEQLGVTHAAAPPMLRWNDVQALHGAGVTIGAHTVHHPILRALPRDEAAAEIRQSKRAIEDRLQVAVDHFAYPNGTPDDFDATTKDQVARAGFLSAVSTVFGLNDAATDRFALHRGGPWEEEASVFTTKLHWYRWRDQARRGVA